MNPPQSIGSLSHLANINPAHITHRHANGHALVQLHRARVRGFCVLCIKKNADPHYKRNMAKIITYCPKCPGGSWICEPCYLQTHPE